MGVVSVHRPFSRKQTVTYFAYVAKNYTVRGLSIIERELDQIGWW